MASLAGMFKEKGFRVTGSDVNVYPPMSTQLAVLGSLFFPYAAENILTGADPDDRRERSVRITPSAEADGRGVPVLSMPQAVANFFITGKDSIVVAGTHGKTTTTSLLAWCLFALGEDPSFLVGGVPWNFPVSYRLGAGPRFVIEGDEYDTAYFDKGPKFLHYLPKIVLLTSIEFDHADIYRDLPHLKESFRKLVHLIPRDGLLIACADYPEVVAVASEAACPVTYYAGSPPPPAGLPGGAWEVRTVGENGEFTRFLLERGQGPNWGFRGATTPPTPPPPRSPSCTWGTGPTAWPWRSPGSRGSAAARRCWGSSGASSSSTTSRTTRPPSGRRSPRCGRGTRAAG
jgi:UDP-N-acetylmuramate-alanine ligase